jgi:mono/diheme cytochrome c family protein
MKDDNARKDDDTRKLILGTVVAFLVFIAAWVLFIGINACGFSLTCVQAAPLVIRTPIPTLILARPFTPAATPFVSPSLSPTQLAALPPLTPEAETPGPGETESDIARPSNPGGPGPAVDLTGNVTNGKKIFVDNCQFCHGEEGKGGLPNPGTTDTTVPSLNPIDSTLVDPDYKTFAINIDLFIEHGSVPEGFEPARSMPAWGDNDALTPQQIADVIAYIISLNKVTATPTP